MNHQKEATTSGWFEEAGDGAGEEVWEMEEEDEV
jgi:hypothetical protein